MEKYRYHILLHVIIFIWGFTGILGKLIHLDAYLIVWYRVWIAFLGIGAYIYLTKKSFRLPSVASFFQVALVGLFVTAHWFTFYQSIQFSTASLGVLCLSTTTLHVAWLDPIIMKRKFSWLELILGLLIIIGIYFITDDFKANEYKALAYGLSSALFAALFSVTNGKLVQTIPSYQLSLYEMIIAFVILSLGLFFIEPQLIHSMFDLTTSDVFWLLFLGLVCTSFAFLTTIDVVKRLGAFTVSLSINLEPVYTIFLAIFILQENEQLSERFYIGSVFILLIILLNSILKRKSKAIN